MTFPFAVDRHYTTDLSKSQIVGELSSLTGQKHFVGLRTDSFIAHISESGFVIERSTSGVDGFRMEQYPVMEGFFVSDKPVTLNIIAKPNYFTILFFSVFVFTFIPAGIFIEKMTIDGVLRAPTITERILFAGLGGILPGLWCYFGYIRPIKKAENWIVDKLKLSRV